MSKFDLAILTEDNPRSDRPLMPATVANVIFNLPLPEGELVAGLDADGWKERVREATREFVGQPETADLRDRMLAKLRSDYPALFA